jgi:type IV pilus assembly protein PilE
MKQVRGFTLIEMMVVVAMIAILAAIALPSYTSQVRKGRRADAESFMTDVVARQQQFLLDRRAYAVSVTGAPSSNGLGMTVPSAVSSYYSIPNPIATDNNAPPSFVLTLTPTGDQAADNCGALSITQAGTKTASGTGKCW